MSDMNLFEMADEIVEMMDEISKLSDAIIKDYCDLSGLNPENASDYAKAVQSALGHDANLLNVSDYDQWLLSNFNDKSSHYGKGVDYSCFSCDNQYSREDIKSFESSMYGLWRDIERSVKQLRKKGGHLLANSVPVVENNGDFIGLKVDVPFDRVRTEAERFLTRALARNLKLIDDSFKNCVQREKRNEGVEMYRDCIGCRECNQVAVQQTRRLFGMISDRVKDADTKEILKKLLSQQKYTHMRSFMRDLVTGFAAKSGDARFFDFIFTKHYY